MTTVTIAEIEKEKNIDKTIYSILKNIQEEMLRMHMSHGSMQHFSEEEKKKQILILVGFHSKIKPIKEILGSEFQFFELKIKPDINKNSNKKKELIERIETLLNELIEDIKKYDAAMVAINELLTGEQTKTVIESLNKENKTINIIYNKFVTADQELVNRLDDIKKDLIL
ncbi:MAG: hypothetical protein WC916_01325 [Candidatus Woesearchaeota archaeon]